MKEAQSSETANTTTLLVMHLEAFFVLPFVKFLSRRLFLISILRLLRQFILAYGFVDLSFFVLIGVRCFFRFRRVFRYQT